MVASLAMAVLLVVNWPMARAFQAAHPKPHKVKKHRTKGSKKHRFF
jgi:hypothetical protein